MPSPLQQHYQPARSRRPPSWTGRAGRSRCRSHDFQFFKIMKTAERKMKHIKYIQGKKEVNGQTNKASRTRPHACPVRSLTFWPHVALPVARCLPAVRVHLPHWVPHGSVTWNVLLMDSTHTHTVTRTQSASHPFTNLLELALVFRAVWLPWIAAAWFSSFFRFQFSPLLFPSLPSQARHNFTPCPARQLWHIVSSISSSWPVPQLTSWRTLCGH